jgi:predicted RNA methylase
VEVIEMQPVHDHIKLKFKIPAESDYIDMLDYPYANSWFGKKVFTWILYESK